MQQKNSEAEHNLFMTKFNQFIKNKENELGRKIFYTIGDSDIFLWTKEDGKKGKIGYITKKDGNFYKTKTDIKKKKPLHKI
jgi:hypothetical protein